ncbi:unnamed protein product [Diamesa serratosioi]
MSDKKSVLFVCLGNICRSPIAEAVFTSIVARENLTEKYRIDSAAVGAWHVGKTPDPRAIETMKKHDLPYNSKARQIKPDDFKKFDYIFGMDVDNMEDLVSLKPKDGTAKLLMLGEFDPQGDKIIRDPYYDKNSEGFEKCFVQCTRCCDAFLKKVQAREI